MPENLGFDGDIVGVAEATVASAATCDIGDPNTLRVAITGTTNITSFGSDPKRLRLIRFTGVLTLTHHATSLILPGGQDIVTAAGDSAIAESDASGNWRVRNYTRANGDGVLNPLEVWPFALSDESTALSSGTNKLKFRTQYAFKLTEVAASLNDAQTSGSILTIDINEAGSTILSTKLTIDNNELTSRTAATPPVISDVNLAADAEISFDIDQLGTGGKGLKVYLLGRRV